MGTVCAGDSVIVGRALRSLAAVCLGTCLALAGAMFSDAAQAQDPSGSTEVPIGTFTLGSPPEAGSAHDGFSIVEPPAGVPERKRDSSDDGSGRWFFQGWETTPSRDDSAESLYSSATAALEGGRREEAQRLFERLIAEAPDSPRVGAARQHLGQIYRSAATGGEAIPSAMRAGSPAGPAGADAAAKPESLAVSKAPSRVALYQARVSPALDGEFLADAGDRVFFSAGSAELGSRARGVIQSQARFLQRHSELYVAVEGFADDGAMPDAETQRLSEERAAVVRDRLIAEGVDEERLLAYGRARQDRVSDCPAPECLAQNRRAVTIILTRRVEPGRSPRRAQGANPSGVSPTQ